MRKVRVTAAVGVGALASGDVTSGAITTAASNKLRFVTLDASYSWSDTSNATDDSMEFGIAHGDYTATEIEECLEAQAAIDIGLKVEQEQANRLVRVIGIFSNEGAASGGAQFNDGKRYKMRLNWLIGAGDLIQVWMRNASGTIYTTGSAVIVTGDLWVKD